LKSLGQDVAPTIEDPGECLPLELERSFTIYVSIPNSISTSN
jgi:hypothetical protein